MKQVININFHGQVVPIEVSAFDLLKNYTDSLNRFFANEEGKEEIINDIESRIGELFQERLKKGATCITDDDVNAIIKSMGRPEEFDGADESSYASQNATQEPKAEAFTATHKRLFRNENDKILGGVCSGIANYFAIDPVIVRIIFLVVGLAFGTGILAYIIMWIAVPSSAINEIGGARKKLFRDPDDKIIAGVSSGIGNYFGVNAWIPRVFFLLPFLSFVFKFSHIGFLSFPDVLRFSFSPGALMVYIILWLVIPEAATTAEKLAMKGEKVDLNSIKNSVMEEMKGVQSRAEKFGKEAEEKGKVIGAELGTIAKRNSRSLGDIIVLLLKAFAYFVIGVVSIGLIIALFAIAITSIGVFPLKEYLVTDGWQNIFAWGTLILFIGVPVIGIITWIIRRLAKIKSNSKIIRFSFISLWILGWVCFINLIAFLGKDFSSTNDNVEQEVYLSNPAVNSLEIAGGDEIMGQNIKQRWLKFEPFIHVGEEDTLFINNVHCRILKSSNDSFRVTIIKLANGSSRKNADTLASLIQYDLQQVDSILKTPIGIPVNTKDKFRNQHVVINVFVPIGKKIKINQNIWSTSNAKLNFGRSNDWDDYWGSEERGWTTNVEYIMKEDGLYTLEGIPAKNRRGWDNGKVKINKDGIVVDDGNNQIRIDKNGITIDENKIEMLEQELEMKKDSLKRVIEEKKEKLKEKLSKETGDPSAYLAPMNLPLINTFM
jgi:phage shock protein PspC (stress-responsive transcriptional regulator)